MSGRRKPTSEVETRILLESRRRCCLCVYLDGNWDEKRVQIVHIDHNASNNSYKNLAVLCLKHHDRYDSRHSQSKGYTPGELKAYRDRLINALKLWSDTPQAVIDSPPVREALLGSGEGSRDLGLLPSGAKFGGDPKQILQVHPGERPGNELLRLMRQGWLDSSIESIGDMAVSLIRGTPADRAPRLVVVGNLTSTTWQIGLFENRRGRWVCTFNMIDNNLGAAPPITVVLGDRHCAVVADRVVMRGSGVLCQSSFWYTTSEVKACLVLQYLKIAHVSGWCSFQREIETQVIEFPLRLSHGVALTLSFQVKYASDPSTGIEVPLFECDRTVRVQWDDDAGIFIPSSDGSGSVAEVAEWFDDDDERFLKRHLDQLRGIAYSGTQEQREWMRRFLLRCSNTPYASELQRSLGTR